MADPEDILHDSPADFDSSFAYALHGEMRRLLVVTVLGSFLFPLGLGLFFTASGRIFITTLLWRGFGLALALAGATLLYGGIVAVLFKTITDANIVAAEATDEG